MNWERFVPSEAKSDAPRVTVTDRDEVLIEQHKGLFSYETKCIRVRTRTGVLTVTGQDLVIACFGAQDMLIRGRVQGIAWPEEAS